MEIVTACVTAIVEDVVKSTGHQVGYIFRFKSIIEDLKEEAENLRSAQDDMQHRVDRAIKDTDEIEKKVEKWLKDVTDVVADAEDLDKQTREKKACLNGLCPNLIWRYQMARRAQKKISTMSKLKDDGDKFDNISHRTTLSGINVLTPKDFMLFESTTNSFNLIIEALKDDKTNVVGLYGMGGVGKTTLAKAVVKKAKEEKIFNEVVMVVVSQTPNIRDIQDQIADLLNMELHHKSEVGRAERLHMRLKDEKKILIILDDIWEKIDLAIIGIPVDDRHKDCKIFLTTRREQVCIDMGCQPRIPLDVLNEEEGLVLFKRHAGLHDVHSPTTIKLAKEVVKECKGLPLAIVTIGSALKEKDINEWKMVTQKLKKSKLMDVDIVDAKLYACLKLSYDYLKNEKTKSCFLLCSLFPEDHEIDMEQLVRYGLGLGLYQNTDSIEEARSELHVMVNNLKASSLLLDAREGHVKMHDVVRDVALWITSKGEEVFMVKAGMGLTEWPKQEGMEQCTAISLMGNRIEVLSDDLVCPKLKILLLDSFLIRNRENDFFEKMKALKVLSLSDSHLSLNSLQFLTNLVTLQLINCELRDISSLKKLAQLEILRLKGSWIVELPEELGELSKLRMLDITDCWKLKRIPANVIRRLTRLEELCTGGFKAWEVEGTSAERSNASLSELYNLNHLTILSLNINVQPCLSKDFVLPANLLRYEISVNYGLSYDYPKSRILNIKGIEATSLVAFKALYENVEYLGLWEIKGCCQNMVPSIDETGLNELKRLTLGSFDELECIIDTTQRQDVASTAFSNLVYLSLYHCDGLREICSGGRPPRGFLENLETLHIGNCNNMSSLFPSWVLIQREICSGGRPPRGFLQNLETLDISYCNNMSSLFPSWVLIQREICSGGRPPRGFLQNLETLDISYCNNMSSLFPSWVLIQSLRKLKKVTVKECAKLEDVFPLEGLCYANENPFLLSSLESLHLIWIRNLRYIWKGPTQQVSLQNLTVVEVDGCCKLRYLFTLSLARSLLQLEQLKVSGCFDLEHIVEITEVEENVSGGGGNDVMLPKLRSLKFSVLPNLINFYSENSSLNVQTAKKQLQGLRHGLPNLEELYIDWSGLQVLFHLEGLKQELAFPSLKVLELEYLEKLEYLCKGPTHLLSLPNLKKLRVYGCKRLRHMFSPSLARNLLQLEELVIGRCGELEYIVSIKAEENVGGGGGNDVMFPKLRKLNLSKVPNLSLNLQTTKEQLRGLRHGLQSLEELKINGCRVQVLFQLEGLEQELAFPSLKVLGLGWLEELECLCKGPTHLLSLPNLKKLGVYGCKRLRHMFSPSLARNLLQLEELIIWDCGELEYIVSIKAEENVGGGGGNDIMLPKLRILKLDRVENFINFYSKNLSLNVQTAKKQLQGLRHGLQNLEELYIRNCGGVQVVFQLEGLEQELAFPSLKVLELEYLEKLECLCKGPTHLLSLPNLKKLKVSGCKRLRHMFSPSLARNLLQLEELIIEDCEELEQIFIEDDAAEYNQTLSKDHLQWPLLFPNLSSIDIRRCDKLKSMFPVSMAHLLNLPNLTSLDLRNCHGLTHLLSSTLARNLLQLESIRIMDCKELEQIIVEDHTEDDHVQLGLFPNLSSIYVNGCDKLKTLFPVVTIARSGFQKLKILEVKDCGELEQIIVEDHTEDDHVQLGLFPNLSSISIDGCGKLKTLFPAVTIARSGLQKLKILEVKDCGELEQIIVEDHTEDDHVQLGLFPNLSSISIKKCGKLKTLFSAVTIARLGLQKLNILEVEYCGELEQIIVEDHTVDDHVQLGLFPNLSSISIKRCGKLKSLFPVSIAHLLSLQNLTTLRLSDFHIGLTHLFSSTLARKLLQLKSIDIEYCKELEQIIVEDHIEDHHVQLGLFPNLSSISVYRCDKLKTLFPTVTIARSGLQKLRSLKVQNVFQLEELFGHKDEADMTSHREMVLPQLETLTLRELASLVNFCPVGYHFIFPSLSTLVVIKCPKITIRFSIDQNRSVHAEAEAPQTGKEDVDMEQSPPETTREIYCWNFDDLWEQLPPYIVK